MKGTRGYVIHLVRATSRRSNADRLAAEIPLETQLLDAVDGTHLHGKALTDAYRVGLHEPGYPFGLRGGEIGCTLSHRAAWAKIVESGAQAALIVEDDVALQKDIFRKSLEFARAHVARLGYIQFNTRPSQKSGKIVATHGDVRIVGHRITPLRTSCQLVSRAAASKLLDKTTPCDRPIDVFLQMRWITGQTVFTIYPSGVSDIAASVGGSVIQQKVPGAQRLRREYARFAYRRKIANLSARHPIKEPQP